VYDTLIHLERIGDVDVATIGNDIDVGTAPVVERYLGEAAAYGAAFVVSLEECRFVDSTGLSVLLRIARRVGERFAIVVPPKAPSRRVFDLTGLGTQMNMCDTLSQALDRVGKKAMSA